MDEHGKIRNPSQSYRRFRTHPGFRSGDFCFWLCLKICVVLARTTISLYESLGTSYSTYLSLERPSIGPLLRSRGWRCCGASGNRSDADSHTVYDLRFVTWRTEKSPLHQSHAIEIKFISKKISRNFENWRTSDRNATVCANLRHWRGSCRVWWGFWM